jgi:hypothetical protein
MFPKAMLVELFFEEILCKDAHLWEIVHALLYFYIDSTVIVGQICEVVEFNKIGREVAEFHAHEFRSVYTSDRRSESLSLNLE